MTPVIDTRELYSMPASRKFNPIELIVIREELQRERHEYVAKYGFYKKKSSRNAYIVFIIDLAAHSPRKSGVENNWEIICKRPICDIEFEEFVENYGCDTRRFKVWHYRDIEHLIEEDWKYELQTPEVFINECKKRGYTK